MYVCMYSKSQRKVQCLHEESRWSVNFSLTLTIEYNCTYMLGHTVDREQSVVLKLPRANLFIWGQAA
jgi:hypothetical protein